MKRLAFIALTTPDKATGLSCLQSACIEGDINTVKSILDCSPDRLDSAIALSVKIGPNASHFGNRSILTALSQHDSAKCGQIRGLVETILRHFQSQSLLHLAAKKGHSEHLRRLLDCGECVNSASPDSEDGETPLMLAARFNEEDVVEFLAENGASLECQDEDGFNPFHHAVMGGNIRNVLRLIELGADALKVSLYEEVSAMHLAAENGHVDVITLLLEHGADVNQVDREGVTPVLLAAKRGHLEALRLLFKNGGDLNALDAFGLPLHYAALGNHTNVVKFLLEKGSNIFSRTSENDETILHLASSLELVSFLVEHGADIRARDVFYHTPLHSAAKNGQTDTINYLLDQGASVNARAISGMDQGYSPLYSALRCGHAVAAKLLIERGTNFQYTPEENVSKFLNAHLLSLAAKHGFADVLQLLLDKGIPVDAIKEDDETALMEAARAGQCKAVTVLLDRGADINGLGATNCTHRDDSESETNVEDEDVHAYYYNLDPGHNVVDGVGDDDSDDDGGDDDYYYHFHPIPSQAKFITPLYCALANAKGEVAKLLIERGADTSSPDGFTNSLVELAAKNSLFDIIDLLADKNHFRHNEGFGKLEDGGTLLTSAVVRGDLDSVMTVLKKGVDVNAKNMSGNTALASVIQSRLRPHTALEIVKSLLAYGADINAKNDRCETPLLMAARWNLEKVAEILLELGGDAKVRNVDSYTPLHYAAQNNNVKLAEMLIQYGADTSVKTDQEELTPLHVAARSGSLHAAQVLLDHGVDLEVTDSLGRTPLAVAADRGRCSIVQSLTQHGSNVHGEDNYGKTPLIHAVESLRCEGYEPITLVQTLLENGSSVNATDRHGRSALHYLHFPTDVSGRWLPPQIPPHGMREFCDILVRFGASITLRDENRETPLHFAASSDTIVGTEWLLQQGADVGALDVENRTPLHAAAYGGHSSNVELLIQNGADVHLADNWDCLPLHLAAARNWQISSRFDDRAAEILIENGSDIMALDNDGRSVLHLALKSRRIQLGEFLIRRGCNVNARDYDGETVLGKFRKQPCYDCGNILQLYLDNGGDKHAVDFHGRTVLHFAAANGCGPALLDYLLKQGLEIEARDKNGETPLHRAAAKANPWMIEQLLARGAQVSAVNHGGQTPLLIILTDRDVVHTDVREAIEVLLGCESDMRLSDKEGNTALHLVVSHHPRLLQLIIENGGNVNAVNVHGCTPLHRAAYARSSGKHARILLSAGASVHCKDKLGNTSLHVAIMRGSYDIAKVLIKKGSDVNTTNIQGRTCLHMASYVGSKEILEQIILHGGQVNAVDELGSTPLHLAGLQKKAGRMVKGLLKHGSDPNAIDYKGSTPLHVACCSGSKVAASLLIDHGR